jgi:hypothetical protein
MTLGSTQTLTAINTSNTSWEVKAVGAYGCEPYQFHVLIFLESGILNLMEPSESAQAFLRPAKNLLSLIRYWALMAQNFIFVKFSKLNLK